jgi:hypothetical protein
MRCDTSLFHCVDKGSGNSRVLPLNLFIIASIHPSQVDDCIASSDESRQRLRTRERRSINGDCLKAGLSVQPTAHVSTDQTITTRHYYPQTLNLITVCR